VLVLAAPIHLLATGGEPADLLAPGPWRFWVPWALMISGTAIRIWGSGNLRKNQEITSTGPYAMVRHPLYTGSLAVLLAYFLTAGDPAVGGTLFVFLTGLVYYPTMLSEEESLSRKFPAASNEREHIPRLLPDPRLLPAAIRTDRFSTESARINLGLRSLVFLILLPVFLLLLNELAAIARG
jgi:hypothetical protein